MIEEKDNIDEATEEIRQSVLEAKSGKHCIKDFSGDIFELTAEMLVGEYKYYHEQKKELAGVAECILRKYSKLLSLSK